MKPVVMYFEFNGDCNKNATKEQIRKNFESSTGYVDGVEIHCGSSSLVNRRKRNTKQISLMFQISKTSDIEKIKLNPINELRILKDDVKMNVIPNFIKDAHGRSWSSLNKGVKSISSIRADGDVKENCGKEGIVETTIFGTLVPDSKILQKCCMILFIAIFPLLLFNFLYVSHLIDKISKFGN